MAETGQKIREAMQENGISVRELASELGYTPGAVYSWLNGKKQPELSIFFCISRRLNVAMDNLVVPNHEEKRGVKLKIHFQQRFPAIPLKSDDSVFEEYIGKIGLLEFAEIGDCKHFFFATNEPDKECQHLFRSDLIKDINVVITIPYHRILVVTEAGESYTFEHRPDDLPIQDIVNILLKTGHLMDHKEYF